MLKLFIGVILVSFTSINACQLEPVEGQCGDEEITEAYVGCIGERINGTCEEGTWDISAAVEGLYEEHGSFALLEVTISISGENFASIRDCSAIDDEDSERDETAWDRSHPEWISFKWRGDDMYTAPLTRDQAQSGYMTLKRGCGVVNIRKRPFSHWLDQWRSEVFLVGICFFMCFCSFLECCLDGDCELKLPRLPRLPRLPGPPRLGHLEAGPLGVEFAATPPPPSAPASVPSPPPYSEGMTPPAYEEKDEESKKVVEKAEFI